MKNICANLDHGTDPKSTVVAMMWAANTALVKKLSRTIGNIEEGKQVVRSSGSVGANYIEANESLSKKDFVMRIKICRKEAKES